MTDLSLKPEVWYIERAMQFKPAHFVQAQTPANEAAVKWILQTLTGRYYLEKSLDNSFDETIYPSFEDPAEATLYELKWS